MARHRIPEQAASRANARGREEPVSSAPLAIKRGKQSGARSGVRWQSPADPSLIG